MEITLEDLWVSCDACSGNGKISTSSGQPGGFVIVFEIDVRRLSEVRRVGRYNDRVGQSRV
jgi:hypothetical protein